MLLYLPQIFRNYQRKSTHGWSIYAVLSDFGGGVLSLLQLIVDGGEFNITKYTLGMISICFNIIYIIQHYLLYPNQHPDKLNFDVQIDEDESNTEPNTGTSASTSGGINHSNKRKIIYV